MVDKTRAAGVETDWTHEVCSSIAAGVYELRVATAATGKKPYDDLITSWLYV